MLRWPRQILFGDVDAMFASAAAVKDPTLTGKPIAVGGPPPRGIIAAASYAVRAFGVRSAMPTAEALRRCPHLLLIPPDRALYRRLHDDMRRVTDRLFPVTEWGSIDEFYADTTDLQTRHPDPRLLAQLVKDSIFEATGLRCTIAVATGKTVAKIAADASKPDGLAIVEPGGKRRFCCHGRCGPFLESGQRPPRASSPSASKRSAISWTRGGIRSSRECLATVCCGFESWRRAAIANRSSATGNPRARATRPRSSGIPPIRHFSKTC